MLKASKKAIISKLNNIDTLQQLLQVNRNELFEVIELLHEIQSVLNDNILKIFDEWINEIENDIKEIDKELTFILNCINKIEDSEDKKILVELYVNRKQIEDIEKEFCIEHAYMLELLDKMYIQLKQIIKKSGEL